MGLTWPEGGGQSGFIIQDLEGGRPGEGLRGETGELFWQLVYIGWLVPRCPWTHAIVHNSL